jgi:hypothetical protein
MFVDVCLPRWVPFDSFNLNEAITPGVKKAPVAVDPTPFFASTETAHGPPFSPARRRRPTTRPGRSS